MLIFFSCCSVCEYTRARTAALAAGQNPDKDPALMRQTYVPPHATKLSPKGKKSGKSKNAKGAQGYFRSLLPADTLENRDKHWRILYEAHVRMITHGAIMCGENPNCSECPLRPKCDFGTCHHEDKGGANASHGENAAHIHPALHHSW